MKKRIAINGFGRIGRLTFRNLINRADVDIVAINDLTDINTLAHLLKYDTAHGKFEHTVEVKNGDLTVNGDTFKVYADRDPSNLPWKELDIDLVLECTGYFRTKEKASLHLEAGAKNVLISAPAKSADVQTIVLGVNDDQLDTDSESIFSNASCTTNCLAPVLMILEKEYGIINGAMTTVHAYTSNQRLQDAPHKDLRRARAAAQNIVPTTTGAAKASELVLPSVKDKLMAISVRVPVITGSMIELNVRLEKVTSVEEINETFKKYADGSLKGILEYSTDPLVSSDIISNKHSSIFDSLMTTINGDMVKIMSWYDNEAGYSARLADLACKIVKTK